MVSVLDALVLLGSGGLMVVTWWSVDGRLMVPSGCVCSAPTCRVAAFLGSNQPMLLRTCSLSSLAAVALRFEATKTLPAATRPRSDVRVMHIATQPAVQLRRSTCSTSNSRSSA
eukprot:m.4166 g.4166  ORF g.4166 m.4166 type:complete len:114 (-) comp1864_c1_seq1:461-802(-)